MKPYAWAYTVLAHHEGGFVDHSNDPGGATNYGVSLRFLRQQGIDIDDDGDIDADDIRAITPEKSKAIYKEYFWIPSRCHEIKSEMIATKIFDMAVNMGQFQAYKLVQRAINEHAGNDVLFVDGLVGPVTIAAINERNREDFLLLMYIRNEQSEFYTLLVERSPQLMDFIVGWQRRAAA